MTNVVTMQVGQLSKNQLRQLLPQTMTTERVECQGGDPFEARDKWLPRLGPTAWLLWCDLRLASRSVVDLEVVASGYGVKLSVLRNAVARLARYGAVVPNGDHLLVRSHLP